MKDGWFSGPPIIPTNYLQYKGPYPYGNHGPMLCHQPPVIPALGAIASSLATSAITGGTIASAFTSAALTSALIAGATTLVLSGLSALLAPDAPSSGGGSFASIRSEGLTRQVRQPITERRRIYGDVRASGTLCFVESTDDNQYLHMVILLASHEVEEIGEVLINEVSITDDMLDSDNIVNEGRFDGKVRINKHLGSDDQLADADLVSEVDDWTSAHRLRGIAYIYVRVEYDRDTFVSGIPNFSAWIKGRKILDPRDSQTRWSPNIALMCRDYLTDKEFGLSVSSAEVDDTELNAAATTCEEFVLTEDVTDTIQSADSSSNIISLNGLNTKLQYQTGDRVRLTGASLPDGLSTGTDYFVIVYQRKDTPRIKLATTLANAIAGTAVSITDDGNGSIIKKAEPRYYGGGVLKSSGERGANLQEILSGMAGTAVYAGGVWRLLAGEYQTPTDSYTIDDLAGAIKIQTKVSRRDRFNLVQGVYTSPINDGNPSDYPVVENSTYQSNDNGEILRRNLDLPFTQRAHTAQRIAKVDLERSRQEIVITSEFKLSAFKSQVGDNIYFTEAKYGWTNKIFEVIDWALGVSNNNPIISMTLRENASAAYDWNSGEETSVDPAPNSKLPDPFNVSPPTSLTVIPIEVATAQNDSTYEFEVSWTPPVDVYVVNGGHYEVQFKRSTDTDWRRSFRAEDTDTEIRINQVVPAVNYDVRMRSVNLRGVRSAYTALTGFTVSSPSGAVIQLDYQEFIGPTGNVVDTIDYGEFSEGVPDTLDYGEFV